MKVIRSPIHGYGVVAERPFRKGEVITDVDGFPWNDGEDLDDTYSLLIEEGVYFDMLDQTRWINHSCEPNCGIEGGVDPERGVWAQIVALRDIQPGEELAYDYAFPAELAEPCGCGAARCRGWIVDEDDVEALKERLAQEERDRRRNATNESSESTDSSRPPM